MKENFEELQHFLDTNSIPEIKPMPKTLLEIAKQPYYEKVLTNIYAFFFRPYEEHGLETVFMSALIQCISKQTEFPFLYDYFVETELQTKGLGAKKKKGRIDLLLTNNKQTIIIESKVNHHLANDLDDYWFSSDAIDENNKIGIILSLKPISRDVWQRFKTCDHWFNLTHFELMEKVMELAQEATKKSGNHFNFVLNDFYMNIKKISRPVMKKEELQFYLENQSKINQLVGFKFQVRNHVVSEVEKACDSLSSVVLSKLDKRNFNSKRLRYFHSKKNGEIMYTIVFERLLADSNELFIVIEVKGKTLKRARRFEQIEFDEMENEIINTTQKSTSFYEKLNNNWAHFASKRYELTLDEISNLSEFIQNKIHQDKFSTVFHKLVKSSAESFVQN